MKSIRRSCISLFLITALLCSLFSTAHAENTPDAETVFGRVTLTFSDGTRRVGYSAPDDVEVVYAAKGGHWLKFHLTADELEWAASLPFQQATVRFAGSEWEHPGELFFNAEKQALLYVPTSSPSQAYTYYNNEAETFALQVKSPTTLFTDVAETDWFCSYVNLCIEKEILNGMGDGRFNPYGVVSVDEALVMAARILWQADGGTGALPKGPSAEAFLALLGEDCVNYPFACDLETARHYAETWAWDGMTYLTLRAREEGFTLEFDSCPDNTARRRLFFRALAFAAGQMELTQLNAVQSVPDTQDEAILNLYRAGILSGTDSYGTFSGSRTLTRAEAAAALARIAEPELRQEFDLEEAGKLVIAPDVLMAGGPVNGTAVVQCADGIWHRVTLAAGSQLRSLYMFNL